MRRLGGSSRMRPLGRSYLRGDRVRGCYGASRLFPRNRTRLQHYITTGDAQGHSNVIWFDDVVVSTERIGC